MSNIAIILAGGAGVRVGGDIPKQLLPLTDGKSILEHAVQVFEDAKSIDGIGIIMHPDYIATVQQMMLQNSWQKILFIIPGGKERWQSSWNAIQHLSSICNQQSTISNQQSPICNVLIHDAARPFVSQGIIKNVCNALVTHSAVTVAVPSTDTMYSCLSSAQGEWFVDDIPPRQQMWRAQTPQAFRLPILKKAFEQALQDPMFEATDDCGVVLRYLPDTPIFVVPGEEQNTKITFKEDLHIRI